MQICIHTYMHTIMHANVLQLTHGTGSMNVPLTHAYTDIY